METQKKKESLWGTCQPHHVDGEQSSDDVTRGLLHASSIATRTGKTRQETLDSDRSEVNTSRPGPASDEVYFEWEHISCGSPPELFLLSHVLADLAEDEGTLLLMEGSNPSLLDVGPEEYDSPALSLHSWPGPGAPALGSVSTYWTGKRTNDDPEFISSVDGRLLSLSSPSSPSNNVGGGCLMICADNKVVLGRRAPWVHVAPGTVGVTCSGALEPPASTTVPFGAHLKSELVRELAEEMGVDPGDVSAMRLIALGRLPGRGGKPEVFSVGRLNVVSDALKASDDNVGLVVSPAFEDCAQVSEWMMSVAASEPCSPYVVLFGWMLANEPYGARAAEAMFSGG